MNKSGLSLKADSRPLAAAKFEAIGLCCEEERKGELLKALEGVLEEEEAVLLVALLVLEGEGTKGVGVFFEIIPPNYLHTTTFDSSFFTSADSPFTGVECVSFASVCIFFLMVTM